MTSTSFKTHDHEKNYRLTRGELVTHLANSGDPAPYATVRIVAGSRFSVKVTGGGTVQSDTDGFFWLRTRTLRIPGWEE